MNKKESPPLNAVEADIAIDWNPESKIMCITVVWHRPVERITVPIKFIPYEPNSGTADDPV